jgi:hypothetical protein
MNNVKRIKIVISIIIIMISIISLSNDNKSEKFKSNKFIDGTTRSIPSEINNVLSSDDVEFVFLLGVDGCGSSILEMKEFQRVLNDKDLKYNVVVYYDDMINGRHFIKSSGINSENVDLIKGNIDNNKMLYIDTDNGNINVEVILPNGGNRSLERKRRVVDFAHN